MHNLTNEEYFRLHNSLTADRIVELLDENEQKVYKDEVDFDEVLSQLPDEDFLESPVSKLSELANRLRGDNKAALLSVIEQLNQIMQDQANSTEYANDYARNFKKS